MGKVCFNCGITHEGQDVVCDTCKQASEVTEVEKPKVKRGITDIVMSYVNVLIAVFMMVIG